MSIFKSILAKIFPSNHPADNAATPSAGAGASSRSDTPGNTTSVPTSNAAVGSGSAGMAAAAPASGSTSGQTVTPSTAGNAGGASASTAPPASPSVDVSAVLGELQAKNPEKLNWKTSIVDLLKLLGLDSSLAARKQLATELHYSGSTDDSAAMNMWLHKEVMRKLAENGGQLPADLRD